MNISYIIAAIAIACGVIYIERMQRVELSTEVSVIQPPLPKANIIFNRTGITTGMSISSGTWHSSKACTNSQTCTGN